MRIKREALEAERKAKEKEAADKAPAGKGKKDAKKAAPAKKKWLYLTTVSSQSYQGQRYIQKKLNDK